MKTGSTNLYMATTRIAAGKTDSPNLYMHATCFVIYIKNQLSELLYACYELCGGQIYSQYLYRPFTRSAVVSTGILHALPVVKTDSSNIYSSSTHFAAVKTD